MKFLPAVQKINDQTVIRSETWSASLGVSSYDWKYKVEGHNSKYMTIPADSNRRSIKFFNRAGADAAYIFDEGDIKIPADKTGTMALGNDVKYTRLGVYPDESIELKGGQGYFIYAPSGTTVLNVVEEFYV